MRQLGTLPSEREAQRFAAWLITQRIDAHAEQENGSWVVWVRDEDQLPEARQALTQFRERPDDPQYQNAERAAETLLRDEETKRRQTQGNIVEMRGRWRTPGMAGQARRAPLTMAIIGLCVLAALATYSDTMAAGAKAHFGPLYRQLLFVDPFAGLTLDGGIDLFASIRAGQIWRLVTPIFIHYGWSHLIFNLICLYSFGSSIEDRRGSLFMLLLVLTLAVTSNVGQAVEQVVRQQYVPFGGISGVCYGLLGYLWVKHKFDTRERYFLSPGTTFIAMLWLVLCILGDIPPFDRLLPEMFRHVANSAHVVGLLTGAVLAYAPLLVRRPA